MLARKRLRQWLAEIAQPDPIGRATAIDQIDDLEPPLTGAVPALIRCLAEDSDGWVRASAAHALGSDKPTPPEAIAALLAALKDPDVNVRESAVATLAHIGPTTVEAVRALIAATFDTTIQRAAFEALGQAGSAGAVAVPFLVNALGDPATADMAAETLGMLKSLSEPAIAPLIGTLKSNHVATRRNAAAALGHIGPAARVAVPALFQALDDRPFHDSALVAANEWMDGRAPELARICPDHPGFVRLAIARSLFRLGEQERAIEALVEELLHASAGFVRYQAARALEQIGPPARRALPAIMSSLGDPDATVRGLIVRALATIGGDIPTVVLWIVTGLDDEVETVRASAAAALGQLGPRAFQAIECLKREVVEGTPAVRFAASSALWHICRWRHAVDVAVEALQSAHPSLRSAAACLLHEMRPAAKPAVGALLAALHDDDRWVREDAAQAIQEIEADTGRWN